ncbi:MAG: RtcB family protein [Candidatus Electrothrix aestuarii]|uniref:3'-phosphate/5'-hydroxy nucleic acid ligase n=1 Tax=Candidatus Electrothrix aestuarii TaxID=3062594 RepID=A0AAU8M1L6_9BACT|nr:RtcB family protein [Candidatus Electrothrix aestuarii]
MKKVISTEKKPIKLWLDDLEVGALEQARHLANLPFAFRHIALMPDAHQGYGMPIGGVLAAEDVVIPNAVGVDIGCGMCAVRTSVQEISQESLKKIMGDVRKSIPVGFKHHTKAQDETFMPEGYAEDGFDELKIVRGEYKAALKQVGTLGGGNHFLEIQQGSDGFVWLMLHSGSRNLGYKVAHHYNKLAIELNRKWHTSVPEKWQLAFLPLDGRKGQDYLREMQYCVDFALANRALMMQRLQEAFAEAVGEVDFGEIINIAHNYAAMEHHFKRNVMIHRKGATKAYADQLGIIPGSQGTASYIVKGKGEPESFMSCSHGAGRRLGRKQAQKELDLAVEKERLDAIGVIHGMRNTKDLDEAPGAYKDISVVMDNQRDLVEIEVELRPLAVIKG